MTEPTLTDEQRAEAQRLWTEYQSEHDVSDRLGHIAGIDPASGRIWIGKRFADVVAARNSDGIDNPLWFERTGSPTALTKTKGFA